MNRDDLHWWGIPVPLSCSGLRFVLVFCLLIANAACEELTELNRGPYLQNPSSTSIVIKWRDFEEEDGKLRYGTSPGELNELILVNSDSLVHEVLLENLQPDTRYYYRVNAENDREFSFKTPPLEGEAQATRVWILGDSGTGSSNASDVRDAFYGFNNGVASDLMILLGDNAYSDGSQADYQKGFFNMFEQTLPWTPVWSTLGNHDVLSDGGAPYFDIFTFPVDGKTGGLPSGTEAYYSFNYSNIHFVSLDSETSDRSPGGAMYSWLMNDLAANTQDWTVVFFHKPPYSKGAHDSDSKNSTMAELRKNYTGVFESYGVDLVFSGHSHSYERSYPILGHRGKSDTFLESMKTDRGDGRRDGDGEYRKTYNSTSDGIIYTVAGSSGKTKSGLLNHPVHYVSMKELGSVVLDFSGDVVDVTFVSPNPEAIDYYTVVKSI